MTTIKNKSLCSTCKNSQCQLWYQCKDCPDNCSNCNAKEHCCFRCYRVAQDGTIDKYDEQ